MNAFLWTYLTLAVLSMFVLLTSLAKRTTTSATPGTHAFAVAMTVVWAAWAGVLLLRGVTPSAHVYLQVWLALSAWSVVLNVSRLVSGHYLVIGPLRNALAFARTLAWSSWSAYLLLKGLI